MSHHLQKTAAICLFLVLITCNLAYGQPENLQNTGSMDIAEARDLYNKAKHLYQAYEKEHGGYLLTRNVRMHYLQWGNPNDIPLVWVHGSYSSAYELAPFIDKLVEIGFRVIAVDYYGHGKTPVPEHPVSIYHVADDIFELMNMLHIDKAVIGGFSRGGTIASAFYHTYPDKVSGLMLLDGGSFSWQVIWDQKSEETIQKELASFDSTAIVRSFPTEFDLFYATIKQQTNPPDISILFFILSRFSEGKDGRWMNNRGLAKWLMEDSKANLRLFMEKTSITTLFQYSMMAFIPMAAFRNLNVPMLIIDPVIENDRFPATEQNHALQLLHPELIDHKIWKDSGHWAHFEHPDWFIRDVASFLEHVKRHHVRP